MPVRQRKSGRWYYREVVKLPPDEMGIEKSIRLFGTAPKHNNTKAACERALRDAIAEALNPAPVEEQQPKAKEVPTLSTFVTERFLEYCEARNKPSEVAGKRTILNRHLLPYFGDMRLDEIRPLDIEDYKCLKLKEGRLHKKPCIKTRCKKEKGLSKKTIDNHLICLRRILNLAREWEIIKKAPKHELYRPKDPGFDFLTFEEADRLIEAASTLPAKLPRDQFAVGDGDWGRMIFLALRTGMRIGEILALRWPHANVHAQRIHVCEAVTRGVRGTPKGGRARDIPLSAQALEVLKAHQKERRAHQGKRRASDQVFCDQNGVALGYDQVKKPLHLACEKAELRRVGWHTLRHTFASHLAMRGVPIVSIQELLGHRSLEMTLRYAHLAPAAQAAAVDALDAPPPAFAAHEEA